MQQGQAVTAVRRAGKACLIAKDSRLPADWARPPWLAHFALQAGLTCPADDGAGFNDTGRTMCGRWLEASVMLYNDFHAGSLKTLLRHA